MKPWIASLLVAAGSLPGAVFGADGFIAADTSLQAGPDTQYPQIDELAEGTPVSIQGCIDGWTWCDVIAGNDRGWVPGTFVEENYAGQWVYATDYGARIGLPIVAFSIGAYWGAHYHDRPWFAERNQWQARNIAPRMPSRAAGAAHAPTRTGNARNEGPQRGGGAHPPGATMPNHTANAAPAQLHPTSTTPLPPKPRPVAQGPGKEPEHVAHPSTEPPRTASAAQERTPHVQAKPATPARPEGNNKAEPKEPAKKEPAEHRDENNGH